MPTKRKRQIQATITIDKETYAMLKRVSKITKRSISNVIDIVLSRGLPALENDKDLL